MLDGNNFIDTIMNKIVSTVIAIIGPVFKLIFSSTIITILFWIIVVNLIAILLMKRDKQYAKEEKRRIPERILLIVALAGGALGMYYAMYKYKHKTLHKKFTISVPIFIVLHFACISYFIVNSFIN